MYLQEIVMLMWKIQMKKETPRNTFEKRQIDG